ncbi:MAG: type I DNA topoisomerase [Erysipelotrichaceae bacterium]|nr:type I DNA topoisomerase [Erysipelotrichaceae bacterium]
MSKLVIVESPSKTKTIAKYLGEGYEVVYSKGHIRDLATKGKEGLGVDIANNFKPTYELSKDKKKLVAELKSKAKKADSVYLATDPDREGEAISWHLAQELNLPLDEENRVIFHEITKDAVLNAFDNPRTIDMGLVHSQETRRILDRIIGFKLSKLLMRKISSKSAGRVQSVALKLIVDREREIAAFVSEEYHTIHAIFKKSNKTFEATLSKYKDEKPQLTTQEQCDALIATLSDTFTVDTIKNTERKREPKAPFITSTMQQEASRKLGYSSKRTMSIAQGLYEGVDLGAQTVGLITYMRTDSIRLSDSFVNEGVDYIRNTYGKEYVGRRKTSKSKANVQDAHEAIRPTSLERTPESVKGYLSSEQYKLYKLIYERALASIMAPAKFNATTLEMVNNEALFTCSGSVLMFDGYLKLYNDYEEKDEKLPVLEEKEHLTAQKIENRQHFTQPPLRYSEARLIKEFEEKGIGRPSTYATIIDTLISRDYATLEKTSEGGRTKVFIPTEQGILTSDKLQEFFSSVINVSYTANMETELDEIAEEKRDYIEALQQFCDDFIPLVDSAYEKMEKIQPEKTGEICPECGNELVIRKGRYGKFISCITYPECSYRRSLEEKQVVTLEELCPNCNSPLVQRKNRFGQLFTGCSAYPKCKYIKSEKKEVKETGMNCPNCGSPMVEKISRYGKPFIACSAYPKCKTILPGKKKGEEE